jgi:putative nucleotidyltransferase with HDIG domain
MKIKKRKNNPKLIKTPQSVIRINDGKTEVYRQHFYKLANKQKNINLNRIGLNKDERLIVDTLLEHSDKVYLVGGAVRDLFLGKKPKDFDLATDLKPEEIIKIFGEDKAKLTGNVFPTVRVKINDSEIEVSTFRKEIGEPTGDRKQFTVKYATTIQEDLDRRDLSINAIAINCKTGEIVDPHNGISDIENKVIRFVGDPRDRLREDPLRFYRAIRFRLKLDGKYAPETISALKDPSVVQMVKENVSKERIREEILKSMSATQRASGFFRDLHAFGMLEYLFPPLAKSVKHDGGPHHGEDVFTHAMLVGDNFTPRIPNDPNESLAKLAAYLHDIGKPSTYDPENRSFYNHEKIGVSVATEILKSLKFSTKEIEYVSKFIRYHMNKPTTPKGARKLIQQFGEEDLPNLIELFHADTISNLNKTPEEIKFSKEKIENIRILIDEVNSEKDKFLKPIITGHTLINELKLKPGKIFKEILDFANELTLEDPNRTKEEILNQIKRKFDL